MNKRRRLKAGRKNAYQEGLLQNMWKNKTLVVMALPVVILLIMFNYVPMFGSLVAFKRYNYADGIFGSPWVGLENFKFLFNIPSLTWRILRNTVGYYIIFTAVGTVCNVALAVALNECRAKRFAKYAQTLMIMPTFISYVAVSYIVEGFLTRNGVLNSVLEGIGAENISWYNEAKYWPLILTIVNVWKNTGYGSVVYLSALAGIDQELFEAAELDGASKWQRIRYITLPMLTSMISIVTLMGLISIMSSNTGLFYQVTKDSRTIYEVTQTIDVYVLKTLTGGIMDFGPSSAVSLFQSVVGCVIVVCVNFIVRRKSPESALF